VFDWLYEGNPSVYVLLGGIAGLLLFLWWRRRKRRWLYGTAGALALIGVYFLLYRFVDTDKKQLERTVEAMAAAVRAHNVEAVFTHISEDFHSPQGRSRREFRELVERPIRQITSFTVWDFKFPEEGARAGRTARVIFSVKAEGPALGNAQNVGYRCEATFERDPPRGWQLREFHLFPVSSREEITLPF
jgi:ketosteroid isomerase-like protein